MQAAIQCFELVFGRGDDDYPFWLLTVRVNILLFVFCTAWVLRRHATPTRLRRVSRATWLTVIGLTVLAGALRFAVATPNLFDFGGIPYSRLLYGYKGYFATAQFFAPVYQLTARDIEHGILLHRLAGTLTIPVVFALCRRLDAKIFPPLAAFLFAVYPLHILFSASDVLAVFTTFLAAASYLLLVIALNVKSQRRAVVHDLAAFSGLALLTQVRPENVLLLIPPAIVLLTRRHELPLRRFVAPLTISAVFLLIYAYHATTAGLGHRSTIDTELAVTLVIDHLLLNPIMAIPALLLATVAIGIYRGALWTGVALLPWAMALLLCVMTAEDGHGVARLYASWLILVLPFAAYGLSLLWRSRPATRSIAALALIYFASLPVVAGNLLTTPHLEILEHDRFNALLATLPSGTQRIIVPDDELMWRRYHSTLEVQRKYLAILWGQPQAAQRVQLVGLTAFLEDPQRSCKDGSCVFFAGIPCMDLPPYEVTREQCETLVQTRRTSLLTETPVIAGPFVDCSIYTGEMKRRLCDPATVPRRFKVYGIGD